MREWLEWSRGRIRHWTGIADLADWLLMMKGRDIVRSDRLIWWLLLVAAMIRVASIVDKGVLYDQRGFEDAVRYLDSARVFASTGAISFAGVARSAYQMPGYASLLSVFFRIPADQFVQILLIKVALLVVLVSSIMSCTWLANASAACALDSLLRHC